MNNNSSLHPILFDDTQFYDRGATHFSASDILTSANREAISSGTNIEDDVLLPVARERHDLHQNISPSKFHWVGARKHGQWWNYVVLMDETRVELYIDGPEASDNKAVFDTLVAGRAAVEDAFGAELNWKRLDEKRASRVSFTVAGGWADEATWPSAIEKAVDAMYRLYAALGKRVAALQGE